MSKICTFGHILLLLKFLQQFLDLNHDLDHYQTLIVASQTFHFSKEILIRICR